MKRHAVIGLDIGTTSTKAVAFNERGEMLVHRDREYPLISNKPGVAELDPDLVLQAVLGTLKAVASQLKLHHYSLEGISFSSAMHSLILMDEHGEPLTNCITWADTRSKGYAEEIRNNFGGHDIYLQTGTPLHPMSPLLKLCWLRDEQPEVFRKAGKFIGIKEYVLFRLFGEYKVDYSVASATGLFNVFSLDWHQPALEAASITEEKLPDLVPPTHVFKNLKAAYASSLDLAAETPFVIGASDGCLANLGANAVDTGYGAVTIGTSGAIRVMAHEPATDAQERIFSYVLTPEHYVLGGALNNGGVVLRWFRDNFYEAESAEARKSKIDPYVLLHEKAAAIAPGANGLLCLPYLLGERSPIWDTSARACFVGVHYTHTREHFLRALMEGVMYGIYSVGEALEQTIGPVATVYANGGFSRSDSWVQMLADVFNKNVYLPATPEGSAFGAAIMGMYALGMLEKLEDATGMTRITKTFVPNPLHHECYMKNYSLFKELYPRLKDSFQQLDQR
ncbi:MAG: gluconokinase [Hymenobacteraceae bacterium]|nr:gluconokinase [Hymenobacteraceae bacterium]